MEVARGIVEQAIGGSRWTAAHYRSLSLIPAILMRLLSARSAARRVERRERTHYQQDSEFALPKRALKSGGSSYFLCHLDILEFHANFISTRR